MNYYHRYKESGVCEVVCTRCFLTLGNANGLIAIREIESHHICPIQSPKAPAVDAPVEEQAASFPIPIRHPFAFIRAMPTSRMLLIFFLTVLLLYGLPTVIELLAARHFNPWLAIILPGDLVGCACLAILFRMHRAGSYLYLMLTLGESALYASRTLTADSLLWIVDFVPTLVVAGVILRSRLASTA